MTNEGKRRTFSDWVMLLIIAVPVALIVIVGTAGSTFSWHMFFSAIRGMFN